MSTSMDVDDDVEEKETHFLTSTGVPLPKVLLEPQSLSSKKVQDREKRNLRYMPPAPRPHYVRSAPTQPRLIHSRLGFDTIDLDNSFQMLMSGGQKNVGGGIFKSTFEIQERLGFGSFGDVFRVKSKLNQKEYAVKKSRRMYNGDADRARQLREVNRMTDIDPNPHLVDLVSAWEEDGHLFFQMELCSKSLNQEIEEGCTVTDAKAWDVLIDMLYALQHLHKNRLVHLDVKPDNIFLTIGSPTKYKLGDFGIIVCLKEKRDLSEYTEGDSRYLAPEVMQGVITTKADVFSLALTILEISCNVDMPKGGILWHQLRNGELPIPTDRLVPKSLEPIILKMLTSNVNQRPEIEDIMKLPEVAKRMRERQWMFRKVWKRSRSASPGVQDRRIFEDDSRRTPEPLQKRTNPDIHLNDCSFSDDEDVRSSTPVFASTPISHSKPRSGGSGRLRSSRSHRLGNGNGAEPIIKAMGSPTSRNLLKEFEAVSD